MYNINISRAHPAPGGQGGHATTLEIIWVGIAHPGIPSLEIVCVRCQCPHWILCKHFVNSCPPSSKNVPAPMSHPITHSHYNSYTKDVGPMYNNIHTLMANK